MCRGELEHPADGTPNQLFYYERLLASKDKLPVKREASAATKQLKASPEDQIKDPFVLEFLGIHQDSHLKESRLEQSLIDHLQKFLLELDVGFSSSLANIVSPRKRNISLSIWFFYNYLLKCFVLIDLKTGKLTHQDIGQMDMYVRLFEDKMKGEGDNPTIGIILWRRKGRNRC